MAVMEDKLNISWDATPEPNDFHWNYTVSIMDSDTVSALFSDVLPMNETELTDLSAQKLRFGW